MAVDSKVVSLFIPPSHSHPQPACQSPHLSAHTIKKKPNLLSVVAHLSNNLHTPALPIRLAAVYLLPRLRDRAQDRVVLERGRGDDGGSLGVEGDVVGFYAWWGGLAGCFFLVRGEGRGGYGRHGRVEVREVEGRVWREKGGRGGEMGE